MFFSVRTECVSIVNILRLRVHFLCTLFLHTQYNTGLTNNMMIVRTAVIQQFGARVDDL